MVDANLHVSLIEVNSNPCLEDWCSPLLARLIPCMLEDIFRTAVDPVFASPPARTSATPGSTTTEPPPPPPSPSPPTGPSVPIAPRHYGPSSPALPSSPTAPEVSGDSVAQWCTQAAEMAADTSRRNGFEQLVEVVVVTGTQDASGNGNRGEAGRGTGTEEHGEDDALPGREGGGGGDDEEDGGVGGEEDVEDRGRESDSAPEDSPVEKGGAGVDDDDASPEISGLGTAAVGGGSGAFPGADAVPGGGVGNAEGGRNDEAMEVVEVAAEGST